MTGFRTLLYKEVLRFWKVGFQTVAAPVITALLYLLIFSHVLDAHVQVNGVRYAAFLIPGLVMMSVISSKGIVRTLTMPVNGLVWQANIRFPSVPRTCSRR